jgi:hypothetical protein
VTRHPDGSVTLTAEENAKAERVAAALEVEGCPPDVATFLSVLNARLEDVERRESK